MGNTSVQNYTPIDIRKYSGSPVGMRHNKQRMFYLILAGGIIVLFFLFTLIIASVTSRNSNTSQISPTPSPIVQATPAPTAKAAPIVTEDLKDYNLNNIISFRYPSSWRFITGIPANYLDSTGANTKIFNKNCNGPVLQSSAQPTSLILFDVETVATTSASCIAKANMSDYYVRQITSFNPPQQINVTKWKPNDFYENGTIKRSTWKGDLLEGNVFQNNSVNVTVYLVHQDNVDASAEATFDNLLATVKFITPTDTSIQPQSIILEKATMQIPGNWSAEQFQDQNGNKLYLINPTKITNGEKPAFIFKYIAGKKTADVQNSLIQDLGLTDISQKNIDYGFNGGIEVDGTATTGDLDHKPVKIALVQADQGVYYLENDIAQPDDTDYIHQFISSLKISF